MQLAMFEDAPETMVETAVMPVLTEVEPASSALACLPTRADLWFTTSDLAAAALPGLPDTRQGIERLAKRDGWRVTLAGGQPRSRRRLSQGGGWEYHISVLPLAAQAALISPTVAPVVETVPDLEVGDASEQRVRDARQAIIAAAETFRVTTNSSRRAADAAFVTAYNTGTIPRATLIDTISVATLNRWRACIKRGDGQAIARRQGGNAGCRRASILDQANDGAVAIYISALLVKNQFFSGVHIRDAVTAKFGDSFDVAGVVTPAPSLATWQRHVTRFRLEHKVALTKVQNPDAFKNKYRIAGLSRHTHVERLNETWQIDASPADVLCIDGRHSIYVLIDVWSRRVMTYVTKTPRGEAVALLMRKGIAQFGVPDRVETDNGSDFVSKRVRAFLAAVNIHHHTCNPYSPEEKGIVERSIGTMQRYAATMLPGFVGHDVADRKQIEARKSFAARLGCDDAKAFMVDLSSTELADYLDRWANDHYANTKHDGIKTTPRLKAASYTGKIRQIESERALDVLLMDMAGGDGTRTVGKQGLKVDHQFYMSPTLLVGEKVMVRLDPADMGRVFCFSADGAKFLCEAINPELIGLNRAAVVAATRTQQTKLLNDSLADAKAAAKKIGPRDVIDDVLRADAARHGKLVAFPIKTEAHDTPALAAAASTRPSTASTVPLTEAQQERMAKLYAEHEPTANAPDSGAIDKVVRPTFGKPKSADETSVDALWLRYHALIAAQSNGDQVADADRAFLTHYPTTPQFRTAEKMTAQFGDSWLKSKA
jgi:putative transposase